MCLRYAWLGWGIVWSGGWLDLLFDCCMLIVLIDILFVCLIEDVLISWRVGWLVGWPVYGMGCWLVD